ncbi:hypothetical protein ANCCAN_19363 [Ancylostoma caninum]|uniref:Uncharacterized protein n=1 Tax=Ancylostoma caninum TaxID=29170 RepID=A0A368FRF0_ANCCA|nr:hypothetical protein ANCCAN_19363 [Ancylostoma caninum]
MDWSAKRRPLFWCIWNESVGRGPCFVFNVLSNDERTEKLKKAWKCGAMRRRALRLAIWGNGPIAEQCCPDPPEHTTSHLGTVKLFTICAVSPLIWSAQQSQSVFIRSNPMTIVQQSYVWSGTSQIFRRFVSDHNFRLL